MTLRNNPDKPRKQASEERIALLQAWGRGQSEGRHQPCQARDVESALKLYMTHQLKPTFEKMVQHCSSRDEAKSEFYWLALDVASKLGKAHPQGWGEGLFVRAIRLRAHDWWRDTVLERARGMGVKVGDNSRYRGKRLIALAWLIERLEAEELGLSWSVDAIVHEDPEVERFAREIVARNQAEPLDDEGVWELVVGWHGEQVVLDPLQLVCVEEVTPVLSACLRDAKGSCKKPRKCSIFQQIGVDQALIFLALRECQEEWSRSVFSVWCQAMRKVFIDASRTLRDRHQPLRAIREIAQQRFPKRLKWAAVSAAAHIPLRTLHGWRREAAQAARGRLIEVACRQIPKVSSQCHRLWSKGAKPQ